MKKFKTTSVQWVTVAAAAILLGTAVVEAPLLMQPVFYPTISANPGVDSGFIRVAAERPVSADALEPDRAIRPRTEILLDPTAAAPNVYSLRTAPSMTAAQIDAVLLKYGSPAAGTGETWVRLGVQWRIDPAYALAFFVAESTAGTDPGWAGLKPDGSSTHNIGNLACGGYERCYGRWRDYESWEAGIEDWYRLMDRYIRRGQGTVEAIAPAYAPSNENDVRRFVTNITWLVDRWREE
jgi:hypothetical protein